MRVLFIISGSDTTFWLSEVTHPYWHLAERGVAVDFASPQGGKVVWDPFSDPHAEGSTEPDDLVSKGFLADAGLVARLGATLKLSEVDLDRYDAVHVAGGRGATFDLYPNADVAEALEHFWAADKVVGAICHGAIALGNIPDRIRGRRATGYTLEGDQNLQRMFGPGFLIPHDVEPERVDRLRAQEHERAAELEGQGRWLHVWRVVGKWANVSIFEVESPTELHEMLASLPLYPFMDIEVTALCPM